MMPSAPPPWFTVYQHTQRWLKAGVFETLVHDLRAPPCPPPAGGGKGGRSARRLWRARNSRVLAVSAAGGKGGRRARRR